MNIPAKIWKNPDLKWIDPACGIGNLSIIAYLKLMHSLPSKTKKYDLSTPKKRHNHIIENMLYMVELDKRNCNVARKIFGKSANIYNGSFLTSNVKKVNPVVIDTFNQSSFDVVIGNPPWNRMRRIIMTDKNNKHIDGGKSLWDKFIIGAFQILKKNGYLCFITPSGWRGTGVHYKMWKLMCNKQILYLNIYSKKQGKQFFNVSSRFDIYVIENKNNTDKTKIIDELGGIHMMRLNNMPFLPNYAYREIKKILTTKEKGIDIIFDNSYHHQYPHVNKIKQGRFKFPVVHSINKNGLVFWYSNTNKKGHFGVPKFILNKNEKQYANPEQNDYEGKYGLTAVSFAIPIKTKREGKLILQAVEKPSFKKIIAATKWGIFQTYPKMFQYFKKDFYKFL